MNVSRCDQCGQVDDHPKVHVSDGGTFHHDCVSADLRAQLVQDDRARQIVELAESGIHGDELRARIIAIHEEN